MSDGHGLRKSWQDALNDAEARFRKLLTSPTSEWKRISASIDSATNGKGKARANALPELSDVVLHRKAGKSGDEMYRIVLDVPVAEDEVSLQPWRAVLSIPELSKEWDPAVESAQLLELFDHTTRICKTNYSLGWPANPRDAVTIARSFHDATTVIDISTSLPRSPDEPAYLRPSPPFVRSKVSLFAWCIQYMSSQQPPQTTQPGERTKRRSTSGSKIRITCFWQHDLRALWNFGSSGLNQQLSTMVLGLLKTVVKRGSRVPLLCGYGNGVTIEHVRFLIDRQALTIDYAIVPEDDTHSFRIVDATREAEDLDAVREQRRLTRSIECAMSSSEGWDLQISTMASSLAVQQLPWTADATKRQLSQTLNSNKTDEFLFRVMHSPLLDDHSVLKVKLVIELSGPSGGLRLNGVPKPIQTNQERDPSSYRMSQQILQDVSSAAEFSLRSSTSFSSMTTASTSTSVGPPPPAQAPTERSAAAEKSILSRVRRNYIYFSSLLQEPEAKWKRTTEAKGVSITQLDSIDRTLVVYKAEATFVGVGLWDLYSALVSPGTRSYWDKQHEDAVLLEDVNELTELWHFKTRPAWPVNGRDSVILKTVYKSPTAIHVFSFSADDPHHFLNVPPVDPNVIRTQVDLQGWAIESLSPTTTLLTLLEQSDPKGWTNKTTIPQQMINHLAGIGDYAIKCGGPPVVTRLSGAKSIQQKYDHDRGSFKIEYDASSSRRSMPTGEGAEVVSNSLPVIECEIRCDLDTWSQSLDVVVDPPPHSITCLRRHRLSAEGGGLWLTLTHDAVFAGDDRLLIIVRKGVGKEKGLVMVNGTKVAVDVEELQESEIKNLTKQKRVKHPRIPLDQPPVVGTVRKRRAEWDADKGSLEGASDKATSSVSSSAPRVSSQLARFFTNAVGQATSTTQQAVAAVSPATAPGDSVVPSSSKMPLQYTFEALNWLQESHAWFSSEGWALANNKGLPVYRKLSPDVCPYIPVHKGEKVIEGVSAEELVAVVKEYDCRKKWDDRFISATLLESFGNECQTSFVVCRGGFPFRDRGFYLASTVARVSAPIKPALTRRITGGGQEHANRNAIYYVSTSFSPDSLPSLNAAKYNPYNFFIGRMFIDGWIFETLDPYTTEKYAIPSTRCTRVVAVDYAGSIPAAVNSMVNASLPKSIVALEAYIKTISPLPITRLPVPAVVSADKKTDELNETISWRLKRKDANRALIGTRFIFEEKVYQCRLVVDIPISGSSPVSGLSLAGNGPDSLAASPSTPRIDRRLTNPTSPQTPESSQVSVGDLAGSAPTGAATISGLPKLKRSPSLSGIKHSPRTASAFTIKGEVRQTTDLIVAEIVVDSKLYSGGYEVRVQSSIRNKAGYVPLWPSEKEDSHVLPFNYGVYTMPSSPLHSSGVNADRPTRHLIRLTLPTAQYQISTVLNPLTGEIQTPPSRPQWFLDLQEAGAIVDIKIKPASFVKRDGDAGAGTSAVMFDGIEVAVVSEKVSLTTLGREELQDDRVQKLAAVLSRVEGEGDSLPRELQIPIAVAYEFLREPSFANAVRISSIDKAASEDTEANETSTGSLKTDVSDAPAPELNRAASGGLLGFFQSYPNPLARFTTGAHAAPAVPPLQEEEPSEEKREAAEVICGDTDGIPRMLPTVASRSGVLYPLSTIIITALIAFLIGSLLRSLLSPADFIYVVTDVGEEERDVTGWREIRRLFELKYILGGWDFQIAVVRRHRVG